MNTIPMIKVEPEMVTEHELHQFSADMSDIGLTMKALVEQYNGRYPTQLLTDMGNGLTLVLFKIERDADGDLQAIHYEQSAGCMKLTLFND